MPHSFSPIHWPNLAHAFTIVYYKIIGQLSTEFPLTNILLDRDLLIRPLTAATAGQPGRRFSSEIPEPGWRPTLLFHRLLLFRSCVTTAASEILARSYLIAR